MSSPRISLQAPRRFDDPRDEAVLASYFPRQEPPRFEDRMRAVLEDAGIDVPDLDLAALHSDERKFAERLIAVREGQQRFREELLDAYGACAVTGTDVPEVLEAAHIAKYGGKHTNEVRNGLLLRRDIHRLFDAGRLTVTDDYVVRVTPDLESTTYGALDGRILATLPGKAGHRPSRELLTKRNERYPWLAG